VKLYFAGAEAYIPLLSGAGVERVLTTYHAGEAACRRVVDRFPDVFLDSGAFSAFTRGAQIDLDAYIAFLHETGVKTYAALDVIGDPVATMRNADRMVEAGLDPIVAFHYGADLEYLHAIIERYNRIALGGLVPITMATTKLRAHLDACFDIIGQHWPVRVHGFGVTNVKWLERYPFHSVDSTGYIGHKYGYFRSAAGRSIAIGKGKDPAAIERLVRSDPDAAAVIAHVTDRSDIYAGTKASVRNILDIERRLTNLWRARGITWENE